MNRNYGKHLVLPVLLLASTVSIGANDILNRYNEFTNNRGNDILTRAVAKQSLKEILKRSGLRSNELTKKIQLGGFSIKLLGAADLVEGTNTLLKALAAGKNTADSLKELVKTYAREKIRWAIFHAASKLNLKISNFFEKDSRLYGLTKIIANEAIRHVVNNYIIAKCCANNAPTDNLDADNPNADNPYSGNAEADDAQPDDAQPDDAQPDDAQQDGAQPDDAQEDGAQPDDAQEDDAQQG